MKKIDLPPVGQKSFYKKAKVIEMNPELYVLESYGNNIARCNVKTGILLIVGKYKDFTATSQKHFRAFHVFCENHEITKKNGRPVQVY